MEKFEFCSIDMIKNEKCVFTTEGTITTEFKRNKDAGLTKKDMTGIEVAKLGLEGWDLVNVLNDTKFKLFFKRKIETGS